MPIDFDEIVAGFEERLKPQTKGLNQLFAVLAKSFSVWGKNVAAAEKATSGVPVIKFHNGAVTMHVVGSLGKPQGIEGDLVRGGKAMADGLSFIATSIDQDTMFFRLADLGLGLSQRLEQRTRQLFEFDPQMFDAGQSSLFDLPGLGAIAVAMLSEVELLPRRDAAGRSIASSLPSGAADGSTVQAASDAAAPVPLDQQISGYADYLLAAFLALPAAATVLHAHVVALSTAGQITVLGQLGGAETFVFGWRSTFVEGLHDAAFAGDIAQHWIGPLAAILEMDLAMIVLWLPAAANYALALVVGIVREIEIIASVVVPILAAVGAVVDFFANFDLLMMFPGVRLTIGDLIRGGARATVLSLANKLMELSALIAVAGLAAPPALQPAIEREVRIFFHLGRMFFVLGVSRMPQIATAPGLNLTPVPDFASLLLSPELEGQLTRSLRALGPRLGGVVEKSVATAQIATTEMGQVVSRYSDRVVRGLDGLHGSARHAITLTEGLMADELTLFENETTSRLRSGDEVTMFVAAASQTVATMVPLYATSFQRVLSRRTFEWREPSPHILAERARLVGVHTPRMTVPLGERPLNGDTLQLTADEMRDEFTEIYTAGLVKLREERAGVNSGR